MKRYILLSLATLFTLFTYAGPIDALLERIDKGASRKFIIELVPNSKSNSTAAKDNSPAAPDFFELDQRGTKVVVRGNTYVNIATGINWYLKYYAGIHLTWNNMPSTTKDANDPKNTRALSASWAKLPAVLPPVPQRERHETNLRLRYDFNYCTFSYSMAFWDWERWEREIDWMALHGINIPLAAVGHECVWRNMLLRLGYTEEQVGKFIAGPAFLAWWEMNNLEGWGGPLPQNWYTQQAALQKRILKRMRELGMMPVLPGYSGMCPSFINDKDRALSASTNSTLSANNSNTSDTETTSGESNQSSLQLWNGFTRPGVLYPGDPRFDQYAKAFYEETRKLYGTADFYSIDPFHEASNLPADLNIGEAGKDILRAMKQYGNEYSTWVVQGWSENPRPEMISALPSGDVLILDLFSECRPQYGAKNSIWHRPEGYGDHDWAFCMLENFGANIGLHGRMDQLINNFYTARRDHSAHMKGWGFTMEGSETNPVMYELMSELPWRSEKIDKHQWIINYVKARYGIENDDDVKETESQFIEMMRDPLNFTHIVPSEPKRLDIIALYAAWYTLADGIYNCPDGNNQQGPHESVFCSRPSLDCFQASSWSKMTNYYDPLTTQLAAIGMIDVLFANEQHFAHNDNFIYDLVDFTRQAIADRGRIVYNQLVADFKSFDRASFKRHKAEFLDLILKQDSLLATRSEFRVGRWINQARSLGKTDAERDLYEWNSRVQITTWGNRYCADTGGLRDYAHKEWNGLLRDFYYPRWQHYLEILEQELDGKLPVLPVGNSSWQTPDNPALTIDWYAMEEPWTLARNAYPATAEGDAIETAKRIVSEFVKKYLK